MKMEIICGDIRIDNLSSFLSEIKKISDELDVIIQAMDSMKIASREHLDFAIKKAFSAFNEGRNVARDPGLEIMRYAAGKRQIGDSFCIGLNEGENKGVFVIAGKEENIRSAVQIVKKMLSSSKELLYTSQKRDPLMETFGITEEEVNAAGEDRIPDLVIERVALVDILR